MRRVTVVIFIIIAVMLQVSIFSRFQILSGKVDLLLLMVIAWALQPEISLTDIVLFSIFTGLIVGFISAEPIWILVSVYLMAGLFSNYLKLALCSDTNSIDVYVRFNFYIYSFGNQHADFSDIRIHY